ncbi:MAG: RrF2 family transcriptional regulator [Candidatus Methanomethylophilaceae archaeon]
MLVSTKGRYALRMMLQLAESNNGPVRIKDVSEAQGISAKYLEQIMIVLKGAGFVESIRGPKGGYCLAMPADQITVGSIIRAMEGELSINCVRTGGASCPNSSGCKTLRLWTMVDDAVCNVIDNISLRDMVEWEGSSTNKIIPE